MKKSALFMPILYILLISVSCALADSKIVKLAPKYCKHGIYHLDGSDFSVFVFCDDAMGTQIGIILTKPGVGAIESEGKWSGTNRFWQEGPWMTDLREMVWSNSGNFLYVITSEVYSDEAFYEIDLRQRKAVKLLDGKKVKDYLKVDAVKNREIVVNGRTFEMKN